MTTVEDVRATCAMIKDDMATDVAAFDGRPLDGKTVAEIHSTLAATVSALAGMVSFLAAYVDQAIQEHAEDTPHIYADGSTS